MPAKRRCRVENVFPIPWDDLVPDQRRSVSAQLDYWHDPAKESEQKYWLEFAARMAEKKNEIDDLNTDRPKTITERAEKKKLLAELKRELEDMEKEAQEYESQQAQKGAKVRQRLSVSASEIRCKFTVINNEDANHKWWKKMMRNASDTGLIECRDGGAKRGGGEASWYPDQIAGWLVNCHEKKLKGMSNNSARATLKRFKGYEESAEKFFPSDE